MCAKAFQLLLLSVFPKISKAGASYSIETLLLAPFRFLCCLVNKHPVIRKDCFFKLWDPRHLMEIATF